MNQRTFVLNRSGTRALLLFAAVWTGAQCVEPATAGAQEAQPVSVISVASGNSTLLTNPVALFRVSIADPDVADAVVVSAREIVINGKKTGTTSLLLWDNSGARNLYSVRVTPDAASFESDLALLLPGEQFRVRASGNTVILSGRAHRASNAKRALAIAEGRFDKEVSVVDNIEVPDPDQILLQVRFAEVNRSALKDLGANIVRQNPFNPRGETEGGLTTGAVPPFTGDFLDGSGPDQTFSDAVNLFLFNPGANLGVFIKALQTRGLFKSLAEPNLLAIDGQKASFLAGGEFPFPSIQGGGSSNAVTVEFREFGIRLTFTPTVTSSGQIRLHVAPEVSSLDFANGLQLSGFSIPTILSRKAETEIQLEDGQTFAIAGLMDNSLRQTISKIPVLGDIPILGSLFKSKQMRQNKTELLVLVTPHLVRPMDTAPPIPTGEPEDWKWDKSMKHLGGQTARPKDE